MSRLGPSYIPVLVLVGKINHVSFSCSSASQVACVQTLLLWRSLRAKRKGLPFPFALKFRNNSKVCTQATSLGTFVAYCYRLHSFILPAVDSTAVKESSRGYLAIWKACIIRI